MAAKTKLKETAPRRGSTAKRGKQKTTSPRSKSARQKTAPNLGCPIVGIGGSAGGFEAAMDLLRNLPAKNGVAFVVVQHLDPHHSSKLASLLGKVTSMPVIEVTGTVVTKPDTVYVQP